MKINFKQIKKLTHTRTHTESKSNGYVVWWSSKVPAKEMAFPHCVATESLWMRYSVDLGSPVV